MRAGDADLAPALPNGQPGPRGSLDRREQGCCAEGIWSRRRGDTQRSLRESRRAIRRHGPPHRKCMTRTRRVRFGIPFGTTDWSYINEAQAAAVALNNEFPLYTGSELT